MIASSPSYIAFILASSFLISLAFNTNVHEVLSTDLALVLLTLPFPHGDGAPLFNDKFFFIRATAIDLHIITHTHF